MKKVYETTSSADAYKAHEEEHLNIINIIKELQYAIAKTQTIVGGLVESAEAEPTVIRSKTLFPTKDFMEWAKRIKEVNPNAVVIPCDAEVASAEVAQVVLCKNCRFYDNLCAVCRCPQWDLSRTEYPKVKAHAFCSYGEASDED